MPQAKKRDMVKPAAKSSDAQSPVPLVKHIKGEVLQSFANAMVKGDKRGLDAQNELLEAIVELPGAEFASYFERLIARMGGTARIHAGSRVPPTLLDHKGPSGSVFSSELAPWHFKKPDPRMAVELYTAWHSKLTEEETGMEGVWCYITLNELRKGTIKEPWWLLANSGEQAAPKLQAFVKKVLALKTKKGTDQREDLVRRVVRRFGAGASAFRGRPALFSNCALAKMFWIGKISRTITFEHMQVARMLVEEWGDFADDAFSGKRRQDLRPYRMAIRMVLQSRPEVYGELPLEEREDVA